MSVPPLSEFEWQISYGPADDRLNDFYIPALQRSVRYDRSAGFFSSSALAIAAAGVAGLIRNGGTMRLLVGAQLSQADVEAVEQGSSLEGMVTDKLLAALGEPVEDLLKRRLEILAWMVAHGTLQIKVVLPTNQYGQPIPDAQDYYHPKEGLFTDEEGNQLAFSGSVNESLTGWQRNYEQFSVYFSWDASRPYLAQVTHRFNSVWEGREPNWVAFDIPQAVNQALITYAPSQAPEYDPLVQPSVPVGPIPDEEAELQRERIIIRFLRDVPYFPDSQQLGAATCAVTPWPHQARVAQKIIETFPCRYMLCDEVGLGKTIEAGLVVRQLIISGYVKRCLILVPKSVARQWQEELYEKFVLDIPLFDGHHFWNYAGEELSCEASNPWDAFDVFIASSQLAKRRDRQTQVLSTRPWDLVLVDEAHHARRKDFLQPQYRPNRLLELLTHPDFRAQSILLLTATPMQVHPLEVWDLLNVLGIGGKWGADEQNFLSFYFQLMRSFDEVDWDFIFEMVRDYLRHGGEIDPVFASQAQEALGLVDWETLRHLPSEQRPSRQVNQLAKPIHPYVYEMARRHTPLADFMFRNTRDLLHTYVERGLLDENVPDRDPQPNWIEMRQEEAHLYHRIEEYITHFYRRYEAERKGLGFVMTVYRRRLTSSFYAIQESLKRRLDFLQGLATVETLADDDDLEQEDLALDVSEVLSEQERVFYQDEITYVEDFLTELGQLSTHDSKTEQLLEDLTQIFRQRNTVIVFTQYADTMDYLRDKLREVYGSQVACYSGRGGEVWNGIAWVTVPKEQIKQAFREGEETKILVCTEAASEGLNLQTCGVLINYDMPWNPMRVEQRIGRIDRIGQIHDVVWIRNYFYQDTIEARVYQALSRRINWFEGVVGELQPILAQVGRAIQRLAMTMPEEREDVLQEELTKLEQSLDQHEGDVLEVYEGTESVHPWAGLTTPVSLPQLESFLTNSRHFQYRFSPHPEIENAHLLDVVDQNLAVTFVPEIFDEYPNTLHLLSYGSDHLDALLDQVAEPNGKTESGLLRVAVDKPLPLAAYYALNADGRPIRIRTFQDLSDSINTSLESRPWSDAMRSEACENFKRVVGTTQQRLIDIQKLRSESTRATLIEQALRILQHAALVELVQSGQLDDSVDTALPVSLNERAVYGLSRHGYPFSALLGMVGEDIRPPHVADEYYQKIINASSEQLAGIFLSLKQQGRALLDRFGQLTSKQGTVLEFEPKMILFAIV